MSDFSNLYTFYQRSPASYFYLVFLLWSQVALTFPPLYCTAVSLWQKKKCATNGKNVNAGGLGSLVDETLFIFFSVR